MTRLSGQLEHTMPIAVLQRPRLRLYSDIPLETETSRQIPHFGDGRVCVGRVDSTSGLCKTLVRLHLKQRYQEQIQGVEVRKQRSLARWAIACGAGAALAMAVLGSGIGNAAKDSAIWARNKLRGGVSGLGPARSATHCHGENNPLKRFSFPSLLLGLYFAGFAISAHALAQTSNPCRTITVLLLGPTEIEWVTEALRVATQKKRG